MRLIDADVLKQHIDKLPALPDGNFAGNHSALKALINMQPTIESSTNCSEIQNSSDCISRQAAIETVRKCAVKEVTPAYMLIDKAEAMTELMMLPSAQPGIIRCKDCKFAINADTDMMCGNPKSWVVATENDFGCILAERREQ